eukprot:TRINITY_DN2431_c0_g2_i1.p1 TRINITY_DN2431_c0_g2~~TRINITY_DN2431_c0_g2_i1.p1  ORF type:complete len:378 (+),score=116.70 TRINITY_DN2431_c0_g2_i1:30-1163(+)
MSEPQKRPHEDVSQDEEEEEAVTMVEVLEESKELEDNAKRVLGGADDANCTYMSEGYAKRQALYACLTCTNPSDNGESRAGICLACSYHCHEGHELLELYTKRNFRCDCGNDKFGEDKKCKLYEKKEPLNSRNNYNQNFKGAYCTCGRPYPDPEDKTPDEMIQCAACEDWYHGRHLQRPSGESSLPQSETYDDLICHKCSTHKWDDFWRHYKDLFRVSPSDAEASVIEVEEPKECPRREDGKKKEDSEEDLYKNKALFLSPGWRLGLCKCTDCSRFYSESDLGHFVDPEDSMSHFESKSLEKGGDSYEEGLKALSSLDRVKQVEALSSYNSMKSDLMDYLKTFAEGDKVVTSEDIKSFFEKMGKAKKRRVEIPKFCK